MQHTLSRLPKSQAQLTVTVSPDEIRRELDSAAQRLSEKYPLSGFRPGKAPYDIVKTRHGEMAIYEEALPEIVRTQYNAAVKAEQLHTVGQPQISITTLAPGNPIIFTADLTLVPAVTTYPDISKAAVSVKEVTISASEVDKALADLSKMQTREHKVDREAQATDKITVDMDLSKGGVPLDGGQARNHGIYLGEEYYVPGLKEKVLGMKAGEQRTFAISFPADHYQKTFAGQDIDFAVTLKEVAELQAPEINDEFAKSLGQESLAGLRSLLEKNMRQDAENKERQRQEIELLQSLVKKTTYEDTPDLLLNSELDRMIHELRHGIEEQGMDFSEYLKSISKTMDQIKLELTPKAVERIQIAILLREIGEREHIEVSDADLLAEVSRLMNRYAGNAEAQAEVRGEEYQEFLRTTLRNRKVIETLLEKAAKEPSGKAAK